MTYPQIYIENLGEGNVSNTTLHYDTLRCVSLYATCSNYISYHV